MSYVLLINLPKKDQKTLKKIFGSVDVKCQNTDSFDNAFERIPDDPPALVVAESSQQVDGLQSLHSLLKLKAPASPFLLFSRRRRLRWRSRT